MWIKGVVVAVLMVLGASNWGDDAAQTERALPMVTVDHGADKNPVGSVVGTSQQDICDQRIWLASPKMLDPQAGLMVNQQWPTTTRSMTRSRWRKGPRSARSRCRFGSAGI